MHNSYVPSPLGMTRWAQGAHGGLIALAPGIHVIDRFPSSSRKTAKAINLPPLTLLLLAIMLAVFVVTSLAPSSVERWILFHFAFIPASWFVDGWPLWSKAVAPFTYSFLHGGLLHLILNGVMLAVMGQVLEPRLGQQKFFLVFAVGAIAGAVAHAIMGGSFDAPLVGASAGIGALYGAGMVLRGRRIDLGPNAQILAALTAFFIITNLLGLILPILSQVAYAAHLGGFVAGVLVTAWLIPGRAIRR